jgi:DNA-binding response OmpR family regulator
LLALADSGVRASLVDYLQGFGIDVCVARGIREIGAELAASTFDVLLIDADIADGPVSDVSRSLRACSEAPLILLLADDAFDRRVDALDNGADDCLVKPVDRRELVARIGALVRRSGARGSDRRTGRAMRRSASTAGCSICRSACSSRRRALSSCCRRQSSA